MKRSFLIILIFLFTLSFSAVAFADEPQMFEKAPGQLQIVLTQAEGVPHTLFLILSLHDAVVGQIEGGQVVFAEPILEIEKEEVKIAIQGEGRMVGARMIFEDFVVEPELEEEPEKVEELMEEPKPEEKLEPIENESEIVEEKSDEPEVIEGETEEPEKIEENRDEPKEEVGEAETVEGEITEPEEIKTNENDEPEVGEAETVEDEITEPENTEEQETEVPETSEPESTESGDTKKQTYYLAV